MMWNVVILLRMALTRRIKLAGNLSDVLNDISSGLFHGFIDIFWKRDYMKKQKKKSIKKRILYGLVVAVVLGISLMLLLPFSMFYIGSNVIGTMEVTVNGTPVIPANITCGDGAEWTEQVRITEKENHIKVKCRAFNYNGYIFDYDVETEDGTKHFQFMIFKPYYGAPAAEFHYSMSLNKKSGQWIADVSLLDKDGTGETKTILLDEDSTAYVRLEP